MRLNHKLTLSLVTILFISCASKSIVYKEKGPIEKNFEKVIAEQEKSKSYIENRDYFVSSAALMEENYDYAATILERLAKDHSDDNFLKRKLAVTLIKGSKLEESLPVLKEVFKESKYKDSQIGLVLAGVYAGLNNREEAKKVYKKILKQDPAHVDACVFLGKSYAVENKFNKAKKLLTSCSNKAKNEGIFNYYIGKMYVDKENYNKAMWHFKKALKVEPGYSQAALGVGLIHEQAKRNSKAVKVYKNFLKSNSKDVVILNRIVTLLFSMQKYKEVVPYAETLSDYDPDNLNLKVKLGILYTDVKDYKRAIGTFKSLLKSSPKNDKLLYYLAAIYQETKNYQNAIEYFTLIGPKSALYQDSSIQIAQMLSKMADSDPKREEDLIGFISERSKSFPNLVVEFKVIEANYFERNNKYQDSIKSLLSVKKSENFKDSHRFYLASLYEAEKEYDKAYKVMFELLEKTPNNAHALNFIGYSYVEREVKMEEALKLLTKATELRPEDGYIKDSLGWYYYKVGKVQKALSIITDASKLAKNDSSIQKHLAIIYAKLNNFKMAKKYLKNALKYSSNSETALELQKAIEAIETNRLPASFK